MTDPTRLSPEPWAPGTRVAMRIEYEGSAFHGWQAQPHLQCDTVQETLELALSRIANAPIRTHCAGRTDAGVHGYGQVVHFDDPIGRSAKAWVMGTNSALPDNVRVHWAQAVPTDFHARFSAVSRRYRYIIANSTIRPAHLARQVSWYRRNLNASPMSDAAQVLVGEHDFSAFRAAQCQAHSPVREVTHVQVERWNDFVVIDISANAFLHHMVRNIAGSLQMIGAGLRPVDWLAELLQGRDRKKAADTASSAGLYLLSVSYPEAFKLPRTPDGPAFLSGWI